MKTSLNPLGWINSRVQEFCCWRVGHLFHVFDSEEGRGLLCSRCGRRVDGVSSQCWNVPDGPFFEIAEDGFANNHLVDGYSRRSEKDRSPWMEYPVDSLLAELDHGRF